MRTGQRIDARVKYSCEAVFRIRESEESSFCGVEDGPRLTQSRSVLVYEGALRGEGILEELTVHFTDRSTTMTGLQQVTGQLGEGTGSFVLNCTGKFRNGVVTGRHIVVPGSGTGQLKGLRGKMSFHCEAGKEVPVAFHYYFA